MPKGDETRQRIIAEAAALFNQHGYEGSSIAALMAATGLEKGGIYRHFCSKEDLAAEAFDYAWRGALHGRLHALDTIPNSVDRLKQLIANFVERRGLVPGGCPLLNTAIDTDDGNSVLREHARKALREWRRYLSSLVTTGVEKREIRPAIDPDKLATLVIASLEGAFMISRLERNEEALWTAQSHLNHYLETEVRQPAKSPATRQARASGRESGR